MAQFGITKYTKDNYPNTFHMIRKDARKKQPQYYQAAYVSGRTIVPLGKTFLSLTDALSACKKYALERLHSKTVEIIMMKQK